MKKIQMEGKILMKQKYLQLYTKNNLITYEYNF